MNVFERLDGLPELSAEERHLLESVRALTRQDQIYR